MDKEARLNCAVSPNRSSGGKRDVAE